MRGKFITVEGTEGVGKSTNMAFVENYLKEAGIDVVVTREPGGTPLSEKIRDMLLDAKQVAICEDTELLMMFAARAQHLNELIVPALDKGIWVLCDRFTDASYAYQGGGRGIDESRIAELEQWVQGDLRPDLTLLLDMPIDEGLERAGKRSAPDRFEQERQDFFEKVRNCYLQRAKTYSERFRVIDARPAIEQVQQQITEALESLRK